MRKRPTPTGKNDYGFNGNCKCQFGEVVWIDTTGTRNVGGEIRIKEIKVAGYALVLGHIRLVRDEHFYEVGLPNGQRHVVGNQEIFKLDKDGKIVVPNQEKQTVSTP